MRRRTSMAAAGGAVITAAAWRRARAGSPGAAGPGRPARPPRRAGRAAPRRSGGPRDPSTGTATPAPSSSCLKRTAPSPTACTGSASSSRRAASAARRQRGGLQQEPLALPHAGEHLAAARVQHGGHRAARGAGARGQRRERGDRDERQPATLRERAGGRDADPQAGEPARADADGDPLDVLPGDAALGERGLGEHEQARRVVAARALGRVVAGLDDAPVGEQHSGDGGRRGGVEPEHDHAPRTSIRRRSPPACSSVTWRAMLRPASCAADSARSGHSTNVTVSAPKYGSSSPGSSSPAAVRR